MKTACFQQVDVMGSDERRHVFSCLYFRKLDAFVYRTRSNTERIDDASYSKKSVVDRKTAAVDRKYRFVSIFPFASFVIGRENTHKQDPKAS